MVETGDRVLVDKMVYDGKYKIADRWEVCLYIVICQPNPEMPVFVLERENSEGPQRTLHRNHILPISHLPVWKKGDTEVRKRPEGTPTRVRKDAEQSPEEASETEEESETEKEEEDEESVIFLEEDTEEEPEDIDKRTHEHMKWKRA